MKHQAIYNLYSNVVSVHDKAGAFDNQGNQVTIDETLVANEAARLQAEYDAKDYQRKRAIEYPPITDYLDGVVKGDQEQIDDYIAACQAVKTKYPKPE